MIKIVSALIIGFLPSLAMADCIDESNISDDFSCIEIWNPVCGCDGITYSNDCFAENAGVTNWADGECQQQDETLIEGRWVTQFEGNTINTMYEFLDGFRYTYYCNDSNNDCDSTYWNSLDTSDAIPNPDSYTFKNDTLTIEESRLINFECDGDIFLFGDNTFSYYWRVDLDTSSCENQIVTQQLTLSENINNPEKFGLNQNYPNPFNPLTSLSYDLLEDSYVSVTIYDMLGNVINNLVSANQSSGFNSVQWDATNNHGQPVAAGIYLYSIEVGDARQTKKMILLK